MTHPEPTRALTRAELAAAIDDGLVIARTARKPHRCVCADPTRPGAVRGDPLRQNPNYRGGDCLRDIDPGDVYGEYVGEAAAYESGRPYCQRCAVVVWGVSRPC